MTQPTTERQNWKLINVSNVLDVTVFLKWTQSFAEDTIGIVLLPAFGVECGFIVCLHINVYGLFHVKAIVMEKQ